MKKILFTLAFTLILSACETPGGTKSSDDNGVFDGDENGLSDDNNTGLGSDGGFDGSTTTYSLSDCEPDCEYPQEAINDPNTLLAQRVVFFDFDSDQVKDEFNEVLVAHAKYLANNPDVKVRLEGHTDERGTREYNLALSEKRAQSIRRFLMLYGARSESIGVYGFGEELPLALGSNADAWGENRRVELVYDGIN